MKRLLIYTGTAIFSLAILACNTQTTKKDLAENKPAETELTKPQPPAEEVVPEGYEVYKSPSLMKGWKLSFLHPERASVEGSGTQMIIRYTGEDNSFYGGLTDGFIVSMTMSNDEALEQKIENNIPEKMGEYEVYSYRALNSIGSAQVDHYLIQLNASGDSQPVYADFSMAVKGDSDAEYKAMIQEIFESMTWSQETV